MGADRTPEERERMMAWLYNSMHPQYGWTALSEREQAPWVERFAGLLARCPALWDSLPPDEAETARKEAEEDGATVERSRIAREMWIRGGHQRDEYPLDVGDLLDVIDRMTARAAAGYPVLTAPKGEM